MADDNLIGHLAEPGTVLLDTILPDNLGRTTLLFSRPSNHIVAKDVHSVPAALALVDEYVDAGKWVAGFIAYEAGYGLELRFQDSKADGDLVWFGVYDDAREVSGELLSDLLGRRSVAGSFSIRASELGVGKSDYLASIASIRNHIREGDVYQINYTAPMRAEFEGDPMVLYETLRRRQPVPYAAYIQTDAQTILSLSPELFFTRDGTRIVTRPMKGTAPAGVDSGEAARLSEKLRLDPKNRAENLMIVDLLRNDLSMCCEPGSVIVSDLFGIQTYPTVIQMTSTVEGQLRSDAKYADVFRALFPSGSVTGAPKIRAMELIREIESIPRGVYCGAVGFVGPDENATFNVAIRTITIDGSVLTMGTGSGVVWDSVAEAEYEECLIKTRFLLDTHTS
ncbi:MAG: aminodeoxychorismate synthase component I [Rhodothermales bacterium]|nr:aminodeoxychorismate synthase component I [Rhodothermales bacterium]